jgi:hypothetical protein
MYAVRAADNADLIRPFAILAAVGFVIGFTGYLAFAHTDMATLQARMMTPVIPHAASAATAAASSPASDDWNLPKKI